METFVQQGVKEKAITSKQKDQTLNRFHHRRLPRTGNVQSCFFCRLWWVPSRRGLSQVEATKKQEEVWQALIPHIEAMELEDNVEGSEGHTEEAPGYMVGV